MDRKNFLKELFLEFGVWEKQKVISNESIDNLKSYYQKENRELENNPTKLGINYIFIIGAILVGLGIISFFAANWKNIGNFGKVSLILASILVSYLAGFNLVYNRDYKKTGYAMILLGSILYGSGIFLVGQIYNIGGTFYQAMFFWLLGVFPLVYITKLRTLLILSFILFYCFVFGYIADNYLGLEGFDIALTISSIGLLFVSLAYLNSKFDEKIGNIYSVVGILSIYFMFFAFSFKDILSNFSSYNLYYSSSFPVYIIWILLLISALLNIFEYFKEKKFILNQELGKISIFLILYLFSSFYFNLNFVKNNYLWLSIIINIIYFLMILYLFYLGNLKKNKYYINSATFFFIIFIMAKYFDWFFNLMDRALFFIGFGVILLVVGFFLESKRKKMLLNIKENISL